MVPKTFGSLLEVLPGSFIAEASVLRVRRLTFQALAQYVTFQLQREARGIHPPRGCGAQSPGDPIFGVGAPPILVYFNRDVHWGYRLLTHGHMSRQGFWRHLGGSTFFFLRVPRPLFGGVKGKPIQTARPFWGVPDRKTSHTFACRIGVGKGLLGVRLDGL